MHEYVKIENKKYLIDKDDAEQLIYDLCDCEQNEHDQDETFDRIQKERPDLILLHYVILITYFNDENNKYLEKLSNDIQDYIEKLFFH